MVQPRRVLCTDRIDEVREVLKLATAASLALFDQLSTAIIVSPRATTFNLDTAFTTKKNRHRPASAFASARALPRDHSSARHLKAGGLHIRGLLVVIGDDVACRAGGGPRKCVAEPPSTNIDGMHAVVAQFAVAPVPEPVPVERNASIFGQPRSSIRLPDGRMSLKPPGNVIHYKHVLCAGL